ncbi:CD63 antigen [Protopterus annectens]|uniref:CD63 antigen n=1 Tax=Protopterus annectens TaxID=7888 RepID=UPI001CF97578|nr:CD63 antigen [Protopterus annectens]
MAVEGGAKCVKYLLFFFNFIFWLAGLALIIIGVVVQVKLNKSILITDFEASGAPIVIIAVGVIIFFIAFFGCCGAWKESYCLVTTFAVLLTLIFLVEIAAAIAGYVFKDKVTMYLEKGFEEAMKNYTTVAESRDAVDEMQKMFKC